MIVVDTNVIVSLYLPGPQSSEVQRLLREHPDWAAPALWRSEMINVLCTYMRVRGLTLPQSLEIFELADELLSSNTFTMSPLKVLEVSNRTGCSGYDSEFVCLAEELQTQLLTYDAGLISKASSVGCTPLDFMQGG